MWLLLLILSSPALGEFNDKLLLQEILVPKNYAEGQTIRLLCATIQGDSANFDWFLNGQKIDGLARRKIKRGDDSSELTIKSLSADDLGEVQCTASNKHGEDTQKVVLAFNGELNSLSSS